MKVTPTGMVPNEDTGTIMGAVTLPPGTSQNVQWKSLNRVDSLVAALNRPVDSRTVISGFSFIGGQGPSYGSIIKLKDWEERSMMQNSDIVVVLCLCVHRRINQGCAGIVLCSSYDSRVIRHPVISS